MPERIVYGSSVTPEAADFLRAQLHSPHELRLRGPYDVTDEDLDWASVLCSAQVAVARIEARRNLRWLHVSAAHLNQYAGLRQTRPDLRLSSTGPINAQAVAEHGLTLLLALRRGVPQMVRGAQCPVWERQAILDLQPMLVRGSAAHVLGFGPMGRALAALLASVGAQVTVYRRAISEANAFPYRFRAISELLQHVGGADALFAVLPAAPATDRIINGKVLAALTPAAVVINLGRGSLIDHDALATALCAGTIAGAALDVFDQEPLPAESPLWQVPNLLISPHVGGQFRGNSRQGVEVFLREFASYLGAAGEK